MKKAFITGITGQDGSYLAELLLTKNYKVIGLVSSKYNVGFENINHLKDKLILESGDLLNKKSLEKIFIKHHPNEVYNLAGFTFIPASWEKPVLNFDVNALGPARLLEIIAQRFPKTKFLQASSARMFGDPKEFPQKETTPIDPFDPYSIAKATAYYLVKSFRIQFGLPCCNAILYNHESPRRPTEYVTRKITNTAAKIKLGLAQKLILGNLDDKKDWGFAGDYVEAMWLMLQQKKPQDFIIASGKLHSVRDICQISFSHLGLDYKKYITIDQKLFRKKEGRQFYGDASKAKKILGWKPKLSFEKLIKMMVDNDLKLLKLPSSRPGESSKMIRLS
jgi:GDPmannose 4,6-dehydratase